MPVMPVGRDLYTEQILTNVSIAYQKQSNMYTASKLFPRVPVQQQSGRYNKYRFGDWHRTSAGVRAPATESAGIGYQVERDSFSTDPYALHKDIDDQTKANAESFFNLERDATRIVTQQLLLQRDALWYADFMSPDIWEGGIDQNGAPLALQTATNRDLVGVPGAPGAVNEFTQFSQPTSTPIEDLKRQITGMSRLTGYKPNACAMPPEVIDALTDHPALIERIKYVGQGGFIPNEKILADMLGLPKIVVLDTVQNVAPYSTEVDNVDMQRLSGNNIWLGYVQDSPSQVNPSAGYTFTWNGYLGANAWGTRIKKFRMEQIESDRIEGSMAFGMKVVAPSLAMMLTNVI